ncbi:hypothetical protein OSTOST_02873 [Ostertagia ostertagi]
MPGRFTSECLKQGKNTDFISRPAETLRAQFSLKTDSLSSLKGAEVEERMSHWNYRGKEFCRSQYARKAICILGIEDFQLLSQYPTVMANKMLPEFDYAIVDCVHEMIFNRTFHGQVDYPLNSGYYRSMVQYHRNRHERSKSYKLECDSKHIEWQHRVFKWYNQ